MENSDFFFKEKKELIIKSNTVFSNKDLSHHKITCTKDNGFIVKIKFFKIYSFQNVFFDNIHFDKLLISDCKANFDCIFSNCSISNSKIEKLDTGFTRTGTTLGNFTIRDTFIGDTKFIDCYFEDSLFSKINSFARDNFNKVDFLNSVFQDCYFIEGCSFNNTSFGSTKFINSDLDKITFNNVEFSNVTFENCKFHNIELKKSKIDNIQFINCNLRNIDWGDAKLRKEYFINLELSEQNEYVPSVDNILKAGINIHQNTIILKNYKELSEIYLDLKNQFRLIGRYNDMSWAYLKEKEMNRFSHYQEMKKFPFIIRYDQYTEKLKKINRKKIIFRNIFMKIKNFYLYVSELFKYLLFGYGEKPLNILGWSVFTIFFFSLWYLFTNSVGINPNISEISSFDYFYFSAITFTTMGFGDFYPANIISKIPVIIEALMGLFFYSLFIFSFGRRIAGR